MSGRKIIIRGIMAAVCATAFLVGGGSGGKENIFIDVSDYAGAEPGVNVLVGEVEDLADILILPEAAESAVSDVESTPTESVSEVISFPESVTEVISFPESVSVPDRQDNIYDFVEDMVNPGDTEIIENSQAVSAAVTAESIAEPVIESASESTLVRLGFAGDINFDEEWPTTKYMDEKGGIENVFSENLLELMRGFDIFMLNNEFTYSTRGEQVDKTYHFRADPSRVSNLDILGVDLVLLANNHVFDYGEDALLDTLDTLEDAGIPYVGAGRNLEEAMKPCIFEINGRKIAYVAASSAEEYTPSIATRAATEDESGILDCYDPERFLQVIRDASETADYVIANVHWGMEYDYHYYENQRDLAERMVEAGADAIIGTHTHCLQGINFIDHVPVFYSLGNYWFNEKNLYTGLAELTLDVPENPEQPVTLVSTRFYPCTQYSLYTQMPTYNRARYKILRFLEDLSDDSVTIDDEGYVHEAA